MRGVIQSANPSKSGKTLSVQIGGQWYTTKQWDLQGMVGREIVGETETSEWNGKEMHWLNSYTVVDPNAPPQTNDGAQPVAHHATRAPAQPAEAPHYNQYQPMVSNLAAHLIQTGQTPADLAPWFQACLSVLNGSAVAGAAPKAREPGSDDELSDPIPW